ncbi:MAG: ferrochelatase, partial [Acidobacteriota bacterium]
GREEWLKPYTDKTIQGLAQAGVRSLDIVCPGFSADCLETLEEIDEQNREIYMHAGGERYHYIPALNDRPDHIQAITGLALRHLQGWVQPAGAWNAEQAQAEADASAARAAAMGAGR